MRELIHTVTSEEHGKAVGDIIRLNFDISSHLLAYLKNNQGIYLGDELVTVRKTVASGDILTLKIRDIKSPNIVPVNLPLKIVYEDEDILVVDKPENMPVHPSINNYTNTLGNAVMYYYRHEEFTFRPVNRLDRDTTGLVVIAKNRYAADIISRQMKEGLFKKEYMAVVEGIIEEKEGEINAPIKRESESVIKRCVSEDGKAALTKYRVVDECDNKSLVKINLLTGRTHQIRVHFSHIGYPLCYDYLYGNEQKGKTFCLRCSKVEFFHPFTGKNISFSLPFDKEISKL